MTAISMKSRAIVVAAVMAAFFYACDRIGRDQGTPPGTPSVEQTVENAGAEGSVGEKDMQGFQRSHTHPFYDSKTILDMGLLPSDPVDTSLDTFLTKDMTLSEGMVTADIGCGAGRVTFAMARKVGPKGKVYALDIQNGVLDTLRSFLSDRRQNPYDNIVVIKNEANDTLLPPSVLDRALLAFVHFHNFPELLAENRSMIESVYRSVKPGGQVVIVDNAIMPVLPLESSTKNILKHYKEAGFAHLASRDNINTNDFTMIFEKPGGNTR